MKEKGISRLLRLKKKTIAHLNVEEMEKLWAGCGPVTIIDCKPDPDFIERVTKASQNTCYSQDNIRG